MSEKLSSYQKLIQKNAFLTEELTRIKLAIHKDDILTINEVKVEMNFKMGLIDSMLAGERSGDEVIREYKGVMSAMDKATPNVLPLTGEKFDEIVESMDNETPAPRVWYSDPNYMYPDSGKEIEKMKDDRD